MIATPRKRRRVVLLLALAAVAVVGALAVAGFRAAPRVVTWAALRRAREQAAEVSRQPLPPPRNLFEPRFFQSAPPFEKAIEDASEALASDFGAMFRAGYFDPLWFVEQAPREGFTPQALPLLILGLAYTEALKPTWDGPPETALLEAARWARALCRSARAKECLVSLLTRDLEVAPGHAEPGGLPKMGLMAALTCRQIDDYGWGKDQDKGLDQALTLVLDHLSPDDWQVALEHSRHEREGVRAGALLLLCHHPDRETFVARAKEALRDPSRLVRISAAVALAYHHDPGGIDALLDGLQHERWEVRWWCAKSLTYFADPRHLEAIQKQREIEPDPKLRLELTKMERVWNP